ncbi:MAG: alpha-ketoglutarate-dependent dioxygenase AlkB [Acidimicrobiales bacterium]
MTTLDPYQTTLFAQGPPSIRPGVTIERLHLDELSWVDLAPAWMMGADTLLAELVESLAWRRGRRPMYGRMIDEPRLGAGCDLTSPEIAPAITHMVRWLDHRYDERIDSIWVNYYRHGRDSVAWHADRVGRTHADPIVAVVSLGGPRRFLLRPLGGGPAVPLRLASGDLLVMGGACQHRWEHCVPKARHAPPRVSVTLRRREGLLDPAENWWWADRSLRPRRSGRHGVHVGADEHPVGLREQRLPLA